MDISVFGLGKVGLTLSACLAKAGHRVIGVDVHPTMINSFKSDEPGVLDRLHVAKNLFSATIDGGEAVHGSDLSFVIVPTPSNSLGGFSLRFVLDACQVIGQAIKTKNSYHVVSIVSTVLPGSSDQTILPALERASGKKLGSGLGYCYNPSFIALGQVVQGLEEPDYVLIGEADRASGDAVETAHRQMFNRHVPIVRINPTEAEIVKLASNTHDTLRMTFANMLMAAASELPGVNVDRITQAISHKVPKKFFKGAIPFGGPCFPRDNEALASFLDTLGVSSRLPRAIDHCNREHGLYLFRKILALSSPDEPIGILGLAYKPGTPVTERSYALDLIQWLSTERRKIVAWDPLVQFSHPQVQFTSNLHQCIERTSVIVIVNPLQELKNADWSLCKDKTVIDCWRCLSPQQIGQIGTYIPLGQGLHSESAPHWECLIN